jgi:hypothetical protein
MKQNPSLPEPMAYYKLLTEFEKMVLVDKIFNEETDILEIVQAIDKYILLIPTVTAVTENFWNKSLYRVRKTNPNNKYNPDDPTDTHYWSRISSFSLPKPELCKSNGRANLKGVSVFYCSDDMIAAIHEMDVRPGEECFIGIWKSLVPKLKFNFMLPHDLTKDNKWCRVASSLSAYISAEMRGRDDSKHHIYSRNFIANLFCKEEKPYPISSILADFLLFDEDTPIDFLLYPSVQTIHKYANMAFHPISAKKYLKLEKVLRYKVNERDGLNIKGDIMAIGLNINNEILWREVTNKDIEELNKR